MRHAMVNKKPIVAILYDFDKTLCTKEMQEYNFIPSLDTDAPSFWKESKQLSTDKKMDSILSYMWLMIDKSNKKHKPVHRNNFVELGKSLRYFPGVEEWFDMIKQLCDDVGIEIEHYIISSGLKEIIEGSTIYDKFKEVYACEFYYDQNDVACWPKNVVNYTTKTQFIYRINKGILDISNDQALNEYTPEEERRVPFTNMIYIGDGYSDVPCMKLVKVNGGHSIAVYQKDKAVVNKLIGEGRVNFVCKTNYKEKSELSEIVKKIICKISLEEELRQKTLKSNRGVEKK